MNSLNNIWNHPKTSASGLLIAIVTIAGVLSQQGISLGKAGSGTFVTLAGALATSLLGLLAKDPAALTLPPSPPVPPGGISSTTKLGVLALICLLLPLPFLTGCSGVTVAQDIVNWTPTLQSAVATVNSTAALLVPADAPIFAAATAGFDAAASLLSSQAKAYLANPSPSILAQMQSQIVTFQQQVNAALLKVARIADPASQKHAISAIQAVATIVTAMLTLIQSVSTRASVAHMAARSTIKLAAVQPLLNRSNAVRMVAEHYAEPIAVAESQLAASEQAESRSGF